MLEPLEQADAGQHRSGQADQQATEALLQRSGEPEQRIQEPFRVNGFEYEIEEAMRCIRAGATESPLLPWAESLAVVELMDAMRERMGVRYPFEG